MRGKSVHCLRVGGKEVRQERECECAQGEGALGAALGGGTRALGVVGGTSEQVCAEGKRTTKKEVKMKF